MTTPHALLVAAALASAFPFAATARTQDREDPAPSVRPATAKVRALRQDEKAPTLFAIDTVLGMVVHPKAPRVAATDAAPTEEPLAWEIDELLLAPDGSIEWYYVTSGDRAKLVPVRAVAWNAEAARLDLATTEDELESKPDFDLREAIEADLCAAVERVERAWGVDPRRRAREASAGSPARRFGRTSNTYDDACLLLGSRVGALEMHGNEKPFGDVERAFLDLADERVEALVVDREVEGRPMTRHLVPYQAVSVCREAKEDESEDESESGGTEGSLVLCVDKSAEELAGAPLYVVPEREGTLVDPANLAAACRWYGVPERERGGPKAEERRRAGGDGAKKHERRHDG